MANTNKDTLLKIYNEAKEEGMDEYDMFLKLGEAGLTLKDFEGTEMYEYAKEYTKTHSWEAETSQDIIRKVLHEVNSKINPFAYYSGSDIQDILLDVEEELLGKEPSEEDDMWRLPTAEEKEYLESCTSMDFEAVLGFNTKSWWVVTFEHELLTGWFDSEEAANQWIADRKYLDSETKWAVDFEMDI